VGTVADANAVDLHRLLELALPLLEGCRAEVVDRLLRSEVIDNLCQRQALLLLRAMAKQVALERLLHQRGQRVEAAPHVTWLSVQKHLYTARQADHVLTPSN
jgi:hypothetical protein